jgi:hypothetical protein
MNEMVISIMSLEKYNRTATRVPNWITAIDAVVISAFVTGSKLLKRLINRLANIRCAVELTGMNSVKP